MKITHIETLRVMKWPQNIWVQIHTDTGLVGLGETFYNAPGVQGSVLEHFGPMLIGRNPCEVERHWEAMFRVSEHAGYGGAELRAISALDMALWDLKGQAAGLPVYEMLGGATRRRVRLYATSLSHQQPAEIAKGLMDQGIFAIKGDPFISFCLESDGQFISAADIERGLRPVRAIRDAVGDAMEIAIDTHGKWNLPVAMKLAQAMEPYNILWFEDPMRMVCPETLKRLQEGTRIPLCISERLMTRWQFRQYIESGAARIVMPDLIWTGGISETHKIAILASAHEVPVAPHDCTGPVNMFACAQICMSAANVMIQEYLPVYHQGWYAEVVDPNLDVRDGWLYAPERPGIGTRLKPEVRGRSDTVIAVCKEARESYIDHWVAPPGLRSPRMEAETQKMREERGPR